MLAEKLRHQNKRPDAEVLLKRNSERFPDDFMVQLTKEEFENLKYHFGTSRWGGRRYLPYTFTENGVAMLSSVLNSPKAIQVNIQIMRTFTKLREIMSSHKDLARKLSELEKKYDGQFQIVFKAIRQLIDDEPRPKRKIGFIAKERQAAYRTASKRRSR